MSEKQQQNSQYQQPNLWDIFAARDAAVEQVERNADADWMTAAYETGIRIAKAQESLLSEDIWQALVDQGVHTHEPRAMGAVMKRLRRNGIIETTADFVISPSPLGHGRPSRVWKSLVVAGSSRTLESDDSVRPADRSDDPSYRCSHNIDRDYYFRCPICGANTGKEFRR